MLGNVEYFAGIYVDWIVLQNVVYIDDWKIEQNISQKKERDYFVN
jgi:hypothetical protein